MFKLPAISQDEATKLLNARFLDRDVARLKIQPYYIPEVSDEGKISRIKLGEMKNKMQHIMDKLSKSGEENYSGKAAVVDAEIIPIIHGCLKDLASPYALNQMSFWAFLSNLSDDGFYWEFIRWRFGSSADDHNVLNWGICPQQSIEEVYLYRAWARGHLFYDESLSDPYEYAKKGGSDLWRSHLLRREYAYDKNFIKAFLDFSESNNVVTKLMRGRLIPSITAWSSSASFVGLTYEESYELIDYLYERGI